MEGLCVQLTARLGTVDCNVGCGVAVCNKPGWGPLHRPCDRPPEYRVVPWSDDDGCIAVAAVVLRLCSFGPGK